MKNLAGTKVFQRGKEYFSSGAVGALRDTGSKISARVAGTENYRVELWADASRLAYDCSCPHAAEGYFCKHCVAVGLVWLAEQETVTETGKRQRRDPWRDIRGLPLLGYRRTVERSRAA